MNTDKPPSKNSFIQSILNIFSKTSSKDDVKDFIQEARNNNIIDIEEAEMITGVLSVYEQKVRDIMIPKSQMTTLDSDLSFESMLAIILQTGHSRFPIEEDDQIIGILLAKDLLIYLSTKDTSDFNIKKIMRTATIIPESKPLDVLLKEFRYEHVHMAIITNEYGDIAGLATIEDVLEEIVGEIDDEHDTEEESNIKKLDSNSYLVNAITEIEEFNDFFLTNFSDLDADTIGGYILSHIQYLPCSGERVTLNNLDFIIKEADDRKIVSIIIKMKEKQS